MGAGTRRAALAGLFRSAARPRRSPYIRVGHDRCLGAPDWESAFTSIGPQIDRFLDSRPFANDQNDLRIGRGFATGISLFSLVSMVTRERGNGHSRLENRH